MWRFLAHGCDSTLVALFGPKVRRPPGYRPPEGAVLDAPDLIPRTEPIQPRLTDKVREGLWKFEAPSPLPSPWPESQIIRGQAFGPTEARAAVLVLHGAYGDYHPCQFMGQPFVNRGIRVLIPAAPCHLERAPKGTKEGAAFFWSTQSVVLGLAQWLVEIRGLIDGLRLQGVEKVGIIGYSIGSLTAGLAATLWPDVDFVAMLAPVGHHLEAIRRKGLAARFWPWMRGTSGEDAALFDRWAPRYRQPKARRLLFLITAYDDLQPTALQRAWWREWNQPEMVEYPHGHLSVLFGRRLYRDLEAFATRLGWTAG